MNVGNGSRLAAFRAQQRLTWVRVRLALAAERFGEDEEIGQLLCEIGEELQEAIDELSSALRTASIRSCLCHAG